jgi:argininosuccinate lyase
MAGCAVTLSRFGADLVNWTSREFGFARLGDSVSTGSSIMPQKRNPDGAELLRAMAVRVLQGSSGLLEVQRGLPLGYFKDLQEDKEHLFSAWEALHDMLQVARAMAEDITFDHGRMREAVEDPSGYLLATEAADWLVSRGVAFRDAHDAVGKLVSSAEKRGVGLPDLPVEVFKEAHGSFDASVHDVLSTTAAVNARRSLGGTAPANVRRELRRWARRLEE